MATAVVAHRPERAAMLQDSLPGPSRRIVVEPVEDPTQPDQPTLMKTPSGMVRNGFKPGLIKPGTEVTIKGVHARDASQKMGLLRELVMPDGKTYATFGSEVAK